MHHLKNSTNHLVEVSNFKQLISVPFQENQNIARWARNLEGDFLEIIEKIPLTTNINVVSLDELMILNLSTEGNKARETIIQDFQELTNYGADPVLNIIKNYNRDHELPFFPTDVYSFHVDRSPIQNDTFLCTYYGVPSDVVPNKQATKKILIPEIRLQLYDLHQGLEEDFEDFLEEHFFDLHYEPKENAEIISLGHGNLCRLACDYPESFVLPCIHRAPLENEGEPRLMMIC